MSININLDKDIKEAFLRFQEGYLNKSLGEIDDFISELFIEDDETSFINSGINDWAFGLNQIRELVRTHWANKHEYFGNIVFNFNDSRSYVNDDVAWVAVPANSKMTFTEDQLSEELLCKIQDKFSDRNAVKLDLMELNLDISRTLYEIYYGKEFNWPFRVTALLVKRKNKWLFKHINFSFGSGNYWGEFDMNADHAFISVSENVAWVASKAILRKKIDKGNFEGLMGRIFEDILPQGKTSKEKLLDILWRSSRRIYEAEKGDIYIIPMKFVGILVKSDNKWKIQHIHFSENVDGMPEERILIQ